MIPTILDFETCLIRPGLILPPPAIATTYHPQDGARLWLTHQLEEMLERVLDIQPHPFFKVVFNLENKHMDPEQKRRRGLQ